jgi:nicotinamidase-related amidase
MNDVALLVIDMQNSFLDHKGENFYANAPDVIGPVRQLLAGAREQGALIVHTADRHRADLPDFEQKRLPKHCIEGSHDADYFEDFGPDPNRSREIEIVKRRYSAFFGTDLAMTLRENGVETVVLCGVKTNVCVRATAQDAFANGFRVVVPRAATNSNRPHLAEASLEDIDRYIGRVVPIADALQLLRGRIQA